MKDTNERKLLDYSLLAKQYGRVKHVCERFCNSISKQQTIHISFK